MKIFKGDCDYHKKTDNIYDVVQLKRYLKKMSENDNIIFIAQPQVGRTNVVVDSVIIFCRSRKTRIFTFFISLEKHLKFIIS